MGAVLRRLCLQTYIDMKFPPPPYFGVENLLLKFVKEFQIHPVYRMS
jgi:hypothetical protein